MTRNDSANKRGEAPIGMIVRYDFTPAATSEWLVCDGSEWPTATYPDLFAVIGYEYGGSSNVFNLPTIADSIIRANKALVSPEPVTWTQRTSNYGTAYMSIGLYGSDGNYVVVGGYEASSPVPRAITQTNPTSAWSLNTSTGLSNFFEGGLIYDGTYWISSSTNDGIVYTTDPTTGWSTLSNTVHMSGFFFTTGMYVCGDGVDSTKYWTATSPTGTWTSRSNPLGSDRIYGVGFDGTNWVMVGANGKMYYASDPTSSWTAISSPFSTSTIFTIFYANDYWVAAGADGKLATASVSDITTWTLRTSSFSTDTIRSIYYGFGVWAACGNAGKIATCDSDPTGTWTQRTSSFGGSDILWTIFYGDGYWVCGGGNGEEGKVATAINGL